MSKQTVLGGVVVGRLVIEHLEVMRRGLFSHPP
jgi:hypothetical protein